MPVYRWTKFIRQRYFSDTETLWSGNVAAPAALKVIQADVNGRNAFLPDSASIDAVRVAEEGGLRRSILLTPQSGLWKAAGGYLLIPQKGAITDSTFTTVFAENRATLQMEVAFDVNRKAERYLSCIPRALAAQEGYALDFTGAGAWTTPYQNYLNLLTNGAYWVKALVKPADLSPWLVIGITQSAAPQSEIGLVFNAATFGGVTVGQRIHLYGFRPAKGTRAATLNGTFYVDSVIVNNPVGFTTVYLRGTSGINPALQRFTDKTYILPVTYSYFVIQETRSVRVGIHKRGKSPIAPRGRRLTRATLDP